MKFTIFLKSSLLFNSFYCLFCLSNKTLRLDNLKTRTAMNAKISVFAICVDRDHFRVFLQIRDPCFNPYTAKGIYLLFLSFIWFLQFQSHFLLLLEAKNKLILFCTKFWVKEQIFWRLNVRSKPVQRNCRHFFKDFKPNYAL